MCLVLHYIRGEGIKNILSPSSDWNKSYFTHRVAFSGNCSCSSWVYLKSPGGSVTVCQATSLQRFSLIWRITYAHTRAVMQRTQANTFVRSDFHWLVPPLWLKKHHADDAFTSCQIYCSHCWLEKNSYEPHKGKKRKSIMVAPVNHVKDDD